jgi:diguanylate cyclase (GGDEF)-like protein
MAQSAAIMFAGAVCANLVEAAIPDAGPGFSIIPGLIALVCISPVFCLGPRLPRRALGAVGPFGVAVLAYAMASGGGVGDGAVLYVWPVLWMAYFFGRRGTVLTVACIAVAHGVAVASMPPGAAYADRWLDTVIGVGVVAVVVNALAERNRTLVRQLFADARVDALTGLANRRGYGERMAAEVARSHRHGSALALVLFDIDHFKLVNDRYGHDTGDRVLVQVAAVLRSHSRADDIVARLGGEEFAVVLPECDADAAAAFAERVRAGVAAGRGAVPAITLSAGVAVGTATIDAEGLMAEADRALYRAKETGRDRTVVAGSRVPAGIIEG